MNESGYFLRVCKQTKERGYKRYLDTRYNALDSLLSLKKGDKILDVGCGDGAIIDLILKKDVEDILITAVDYDENILKEVRDTFNIQTEDMNFVNADIRQLPFANDVFDQTICFHVIEHLESDDIKIILKELLRVTKERLYLGFPNKYSLLRIWEIVSVEGIVGLFKKIVCYLNINKPLVISSPKYSKSKHVYYSSYFLKKLLRGFGYKTDKIKKVYLPIKFLDISQLGLSTPFGHSIIIKLSIHGE